MRYDWEKIKSLAGTLSAQEIVIYLKMGKPSEKTLKRIEDLVSAQKLQDKINASKVLKNKAKQGNITALKTLVEPEKTDVLQEGFTQAQYAEKMHISRSAVNQMIKAGKLGWNGRTGKESRVWPLASAGQEDLATVRIEKVKADTALQIQKLEASRRVMLQNACQIFEQAFSAAYGPLSAGLVNLHLSQEQLEKLKGTADSCLQSFTVLMEKYCAEFIETGSFAAE